MHIVKALQIEGAKEPLTLELDCHHIVRALKIYSKVSSRRITHFTHPERGGTMHKILGIAKDSYKLMMLCVVVQDVVDCS